MARLGKEQSGDVSDDGDRVKARRERLGIDKIDLAKEAGVSRDTLAAIEAGEGFRRSSLTKLEQALSRLEEEAGISSPPHVEEPHERFVEFTVNGLYGAESVVVRGPVEDREALLEMVERLMRGSSTKPPGRDS
jgi:transcriptional regulator with XRE-family HTH domain